MTDMFLRILGMVQSWLGINRTITRLDNKPPEPIESVSRAEDVENQGRWYYLRDILDQLDEYFRFLGFVKKCDADSFDLFSRVGGVIVSPKVFGHSSELPAQWRSGFRQSFGCILAFHEGDEGENLCPKFMYFRKIKFKQGCQPFKGDTYECVLLYASKKDNSLSYPLVFHVGVSSEGDVVLLKTLITNRFKRRVWQYPSILATVFQENKHDNRFKTLREYARFIFCWAVSLHDTATADVRVSARLGASVAAFSVDLLRMPYFFKERDFVPAKDGKRKRIFHIVRTHKRVTRKGETYVKSHFRGSRKFQWNGYQINISMAGKHHNDLKELTTAALDGYRKTKEHIYSDEFGGAISRHLAR